MAKIIFVEPSGAERVVEVPEGWTLMQAATANGVEGLDADCGGACACATCHCYVDERAAAALAAPTASELAMLENVAAERRANSRLSCQVRVERGLEGLVVRLPEKQS